MLKKLLNVFFRNEEENNNIKINDTWVTTPECPYCSHILEKMPGRKKKCPECKSYIFVRTSPISGNKVLIKEDQIPEIEEAWSIKNGTHQEYVFEKERQNRRIEHRQEQNLNASFKRSDSDLNWSFLNSELEYFAQHSNWYGYRETKFEMAEQLLNEKKYENALFSYLEVAYRDLSSSEELIDSRVYEAIGKIKKANKMKQSDIKEVWDKYIPRISLPLSRDEAWKEILELIKLG